MSWNPQKSYTGSFNRKRDAQSTKVALLGEKREQERLIQGLIERIRPNSDERRLLLRLTPGGEELRQKAYKIPSAMKECIKLSKEELQLLKELLKKALHSMETNNQ